MIAYITDWSLFAALVMTLMLITNVQDGPDSNYLDFALAARPSRRY